MSRSSSPAWETMKENAQPLSRGRCASELSAALSKKASFSKQSTSTLSSSTSPSTSPSQSQKTTHDFATLLYKTLTPFVFNLPPVTSFLSKIQSLNASNSLLYKSLLEDLLNHYLLLPPRSPPRLPPHSNSIPLVRLFVTYAGMCGDSLSVLNYLAKECGVGGGCGLMTVARCWVMEKGGDYKGCERLYDDCMASFMAVSEGGEEGDEEKEKGRKMVEVRRKQFLRRMSRRFLDNEIEDYSSVASEGSGNGNGNGIDGQATGAAYDENGTEIYETSQMQIRSKPLARLGRGDVGDNWRSGREEDRRRGKGLSKGNGGGGGNNENGNGVEKEKEKEAGFTIFSDGGNGNGNNEQKNEDYDHRPFAREHERKKENEQEAEAWNKSGGLRMGKDVRQPITTGGGGFDIYHDEGEGSEWVDGDSYENRFKREPKDRKADREKSLRKLERDKSEKKETGKGKQQQQQQQGMKCGFSKRLVTRDSKGFERCFEESRAKGKFHIAKREEEFNHYLKQEEEEKEENDDQSVEMEDCSQDATNNSSCVMNDSGVNVGMSFLGGDMTNEPTINTKLAMADLGLMFGGGFGSPVKEEEEEEDGEVENSNSNKMGGGGFAIFSDEAPQNTSDSSGENENEHGNGNEIDNGDDEDATVSVSILADLMAQIQQDVETPTGPTPAIIKKKKKAALGESAIALGAKVTNKEKMAGVAGAGGFAIFNDDNEDHDSSFLVDETSKPGSPTNFLNSNAHDGKEGGENNPDVSRIQIFCD